MEFHTNLQSIAVLISIIAASAGGGRWFLNWYKEPRLIDGKYFQSAWIEYGNDENKVYVEYVPDGIGNTIFLSTHEAVRRVAEKAKINPKIDSKPIHLSIMLRKGTELVRQGDVVLHSDIWKRLACVKLAHPARVEIMKRLLPYVNLNFINFDYTVFRENGVTGKMDSYYFNNVMNTNEYIMMIYSHEDLQNKIDEVNTKRYWVV
jgi:hypothetical protein